MMIGNLIRIALRRPGLGVGLVKDLIRDRLGQHRETERVHLLDVLRYLRRCRGRADLNGKGVLDLELPASEPARGVRLRLDESDVKVFRELFVHSEYASALELLAGAGDRPVIVDAGANVGLATLYLKGRVPGARVVAIEPDASNVACFQEHIRLNRFEDVTVHTAALWPRECRLRFVADPTRLQSWAIRVEEDAAGPVEAISVQGLMRRHGFERIDLLKLDVEGAEFPLFEDAAAGEWLSRTRAILAEVHPDLGDPARVRERLVGAGFRVREYGMNMLAAWRE